VSGVRFCWFVRGLKISAFGLEDHMIQIAAKGIEFDGIVAGCFFLIRVLLLGEIS
jgi:hypothetical protein